VAVGPSVASVRSRGRRWIVTNTTICALASASRAMVSPCFGPSQLHPLRSPPVPALDRGCAHTRPPLLADADATGTPQLLWFRNGTFVGAYEGEHDAKAIKTWAAQKGSADVDAGAE
jgi:hypothetical protein